jgi:hypothetical protein
MDLPQFPLSDSTWPGAFFTAALPVLDSSLYPLRPKALLTPRWPGNYWDGPPPKPVEGVEVNRGGVPWRFAPSVSIRVGDRPS